MEGWIIWIIIIIAWAVISNLSKKKETEDYVEALQENRFTIFVEEGIPPKKTGIDTECYTVQLKGMCNNLNDDTIKLLFYVYDNTDAEDDDFGLPVVAAHEALSEPGSRILGRHEIVETTANQYWPKYFTWFYLPKELVIPPHKGKRKLKFWAAVAEPDIQPERGGFADSELKKIIYSAKQIVDCKFNEIGYMDEIVNREAVEDLTIQLGMGMAASDGHLDQKELNKIKDWIRTRIEMLDDEKIKKEKKKHFSEFVKATYAKAKNKRLSISNLVEQFNDKAGRSQKYEAIQLLLDIASADEKLHREEEKFINKIVKTTGINLKTFKEMKNKVIANIGNIDTSEETSEEMFGITSDMNKAEKCKLLRKEYTKWNAQTTHKELKRRKRAKQLVKIVADLRKKYKC